MALSRDWEMMDLIVSEQLETDLETYKEIIENKCTEEEMNFIIMTFLEQDLDNYKKAKQTFNKYLNKNKFEIKASSYGLDFNDSLTDNYKRSLTQYFTPKHIINPSKQVYISLPNKTIFQENHSNFTINKDYLQYILFITSSFMLNL